LRLSWAVTIVSSKSHFVQPNVVCPAPAVPTFCNPAPPQSEVEFLHHRFVTLDTIFSEGVSVH
jgi:hypothetical protein